MVYYKVLFVTFANFKNISFTTALTGFFYETLLNTCMMELNVLRGIIANAKKKMGLKNVYH